MVDIANLPAEKKNISDKILPELPLIMKPKELTPEEARELNEVQCTDIFLHFDENNVNYLTWDQINKNFKEMSIFKMINTKDSKSSVLKRNDSSDYKNLGTTIQKTHKQNHEK